MALVLAEAEPAGHRSQGTVDAARRWRYQQALVEIDVRLAVIRERLAQRPHVRFAGEVGRRAAVAAVLRAAPDSTELLLIKRAERVGDPWSGHMALPGGHHDQTDADLLATVKRETLEEVGLDLRQHELLGPLDEHAATVKGVFSGLLLAPFVFALSQPDELRLNHEVAEAIWVPLGPIVRGERDIIQELEHDGRPVRFPGYRVGDHIVWGLTHRVLSNLFGILT
jgi:8-oxo-dGTP pyrophosphatase MutT (NUDIX family)